MKKFIKAVAFLAVISTVSCSDAPVEVTASDICTEEYKDVIVTTEGALRLPESFYTTGGTVTMVLEAPAGKYRLPKIAVLTWNKDNEKKNMMEPLKNGFSDADVKIYDDKGQEVKLGDKIRVTGKVGGASNDWCDIFVDKIEKVK
ncbi:hypothetical protein [uncultured Flavobacterium sp.]|uniref:hypothetical protein n=1 Tax=uncultured Flavobacterium sp. TaxID=165435 RepID=UPI0025E036FD|nr:hypothetical protein [uncultured Flavobacterium sp.]